MYTYSNVCICCFYKAVPSLSQAVLATFTGYVQTFSQADMNSFLTYSGVTPFNINAFGTTPVAASACTTSNWPCSEGNLDTQYIAGIAQGAKSIFWYSDGGSYSQDPWVDVLNQIIALPASSRPSVVSISYGSDESSYPPVFMDAFNKAALSLGLLGVTIFASSGDNGASMDSGSCLTDTSKTQTRCVYIYIYIHMYFSAFVYTMHMYALNTYVSCVFNIVGPVPIPGADKGSCLSGLRPALMSSLLVSKIL